ncbi:MAG: metallopeptidase TldD-related protein, partial [Asticcacaulis sp.]
MKRSVMGLEGDFNRKGTSAFSGKMGQAGGQAGASPSSTTAPCPTPGDRSILTDEGTATSCTTLIEDGILVGYMHDRLSARRMGAQATGNGRRQSYAHQPLPRMTNTFMRGGQDKLADMIANTKKGLYAVNFGGGQVDITNGKFVFQCTEAYLIEDGKVGAPVKGATLIGDGPAAMSRVDMIGDDFKFDPGVRHPAARRTIHTGRYRSAFLAYPGPDRRRHELRRAFVLLAATILLSSPLSAFAHKNPPPTRRRHRPKLPCSNGCRPTIPRSTSPRSSRHRWRGLFEMTYSHKIAYVDASGRYFITGDLLDLKARQRTCRPMPRPAPGASIRQNCRWRIRSS